MISLYCLMIVDRERRLCMWKKLMSINVVLLFAFALLNTPTFAKQECANVNVSYSTEREVSIEGNASLIKGTTQHCYKAYFDGIETQNVVWEVKGTTSENTRIDEGGFLTVGVEEEASQFELIAYSANQTSNYSTNTISLIDKSYVIAEVLSEKLPTTTQTLPYGTTESDLHKMFSKWNAYELTFHTNDEKIYQIPISEATYSSTDIKSDENGVIQPGTFTVYFEPKLPYVLVEFDDTIHTDYDQKTNLSGDHTLVTTFTIDGDQKTTQQSNTVVKGTAKAEESNAMYAIMILLAGSLSILCLCKVIHNHKRHNTIK